MRKRGQFYLVAAIVIISIVAALITISNYTKKNQTVLVNEFAKELDIETQKVLSYDIINTDTKIHQYGKDYSKHRGSDIELYFIMGDKGAVEAYQYINGVEKLMTGSITETTDKIIFNLYGTDYEFPLMQSDNFYYLVLQKIKGEDFVITG